MVHIETPKVKVPRANQKNAKRNPATEASAKMACCLGLSLGLRVYLVAEFHGLEFRV